MRTLHQHQLRPRIYFGFGFGWSTDRLYDEKSKTKKIEYRSQF